METEEFVVAVSWLAEDDVQYWRPDLRSELGRFFGWTDTVPWYRDRERLDKVHALILERQSELFRDLGRKRKRLMSRPASAGSIR